MGLLRRLGRRAGAFLDGAEYGVRTHMSPMNYAPGRFGPVSNMISGAAIGAPLGAVGAAASGQDPGAGVAAGAALGAGAGLGGAALRLGGSALMGGAREMAEREPALLLEKIKQEAMQWVRGARDQARITAAQSPEEVQRVVEEVVSRTPVRGQGGF